MVWDILFWVGIALIILVGIFVAIIVAGSLMPRYHQVSRAIDIQQAPDIVWQAITNFASVPSWHKEVIKVEKLDDRDGHEVWRETYKGDYPLTLETTECVPPRRLVRHIADVGGPFTGRWEFDLAPTEEGSRLTITEHGDIANPFFRFMARLFMNPATYLEMYLEALAAKYGQEPAIQKL